MARPTKDPRGLSKPVSFRLSQDDHQAYLAKVAASGLGKSEFFRDCVLTNQTTVIARPKTSADKNKLLYLVNKTSNNINQLAHRVNADHVAGKVAENTYASVLMDLELITRYLKATLRHVD